MSTTLLPERHRAGLRTWVLFGDPTRSALCWLALALVGSVFLFDAPRYTLLSTYTDHMRHTYAAWSFLHLGFGVYTQPMGTWDVAAVEPFVTWPTLPHMYPFGSLLLFLPAALLVNLSVLAPATTYALLVAAFTGAGTLAMALLYRTLPYPPGLAALVTALAAMPYLFWGLNGFFDTVAVALALVGVAAHRREGERVSLFALIGALSLHFRLWYLGPLALATAWRYWRERGVDAAFVGALALGGLSLASFALTLPAAGRLGETEMFTENPVALTTGAGITPETGVALAGAAVLLGVLYTRERDPVALAALTLAVASVFALSQWVAWYPILLTPALALADRRASQVALVVAFLQVSVSLGNPPNWFAFAEAVLRATVGWG
ncbi:hypothetical protein [Halomarina litorea]|uniref:hypothetical protein n=1 Tax=Halomarina litorea TaxID=2961595 RepID=UPI0020C2252E|nr:hypothetical protein [Halomarina sp. BCD28]